MGYQQSLVIRLSSSVLRMLQPRPRSPQDAKSRTTPIWPDVTAETIRHLQALLRLDIWVPGIWDRYNPIWPRSESMLKE